MNISGYSDIHAIGHKLLTNLFTGPVVVQEKTDGSQFSFCQQNGQLSCRSRGQQIHLGEPGMFSKAVETVRSLQGLLIENRIYRCEYIQKPKHNALTYARVPKGYLVLWDAEDMGQNYLAPEALTAEAIRLGLEPVPLIWEGVQSFLGWNHGLECWLTDMLDRESCLGGCKVEGIVVKNYHQFGADHKILVGKFVSAAFKEIHREASKKLKPQHGDIVQQIAACYQTPARFNKVVQHLREAGQINGTPQDIGPLLKELHLDIAKECTDDIKDQLFKHFWKPVIREIAKTFPDFYKQQIGILPPAPSAEPTAEPVATEPTEVKQ